MVHIKKKKSLKKKKKEMLRSTLIYVSKYHSPGFPGGAVVENPPANAGDTGSSPGLGGSHMPRSN